MEQRKNIPVLIQQGDKKILMVKGEPFIALAGEVHNSDSSSPKYMDKIWNIAENLGMNTLLLPVTWEMIEPKEEMFDFSVPQKLVNQARERKKKIIFLWFGSWKNAEMMYTPEWVKKDLNRFKRGQIVKGQNKAGRMISPNMPYKFPYTTISYLCKEAMESDAKAFAAFMRWLKTYDEEESTVISVQVENETGLLGAAREMSDEADKLFEGQVPQSFVEYMLEHTMTMVPDVKKAVESGVKNGTWQEVFGAVAEEMFSAYYVSQYVEYVAKAGKDIYPLPMLVNCWLDKGGEPGSYPTGGPVSRVHEIWNYCAPSIDVFCPDIYVPNFMEICEEYVRRGNPLMIPESATHSYCAPRMVYTVGHHHAICYSTFGFDDIGKPFNAVQSYLFGVDVNDPALKTPQNFEEYGLTGKLLGSLLPIIGKQLGTANLDATCGEGGTASEMQLGNLRLVTTYQNMMQPRNDGYCLCVKVAEDECYILGNACGIEFTSNNSELTNLDLLIVEEGIFDSEGKWKAGRRLNGDETSRTKFSEPSILHVKYFVYN